MTNVKVPLLYYSLLKSLKDANIKSQN